MPKNTYAVTAPNGKVFKRKTDRTYTHAVICRTDWAWRRHSAANPHPQGVAVTISNYGFNVRELGPNPRWSHTPEQLERMREQIAGCSDANDYVEKLKRAEMASVEADYLAKGDDDWGVVGFCGRLDLAQKLASKGLYHCKDLTVVEAVKL
jgi:hypothetical protein